MRKPKGFTIIELTLAITFISLILLAITFLIFHVITTYQKGLSIKAVSAVGRELIDEFSRSIAISPAKDSLALCSEHYNVSLYKSAHEKCIKDGARKFIYQQRFGRVSIKGVEKDVPVSGAFCTGQYSYIWSTGYTMNDKNYPGGSNHRAVYLRQDAPENKNFRLIKIEDANRLICSNNISNSEYRYETNNNFYKVTRDQDVGVDAEEILSNSENNLAIYDMEIFHPTQHQNTLHSFYSGTFILATVQGGVDITGTGDYCNDPPGGLSSDFTYCAINKFNFAMRATGEYRTNEK